MPKHTLRNLDLTTLSIALDHVEEHGPATATPDPDTIPTECVYLKFIGDAPLNLLAARLPYRNILLHTLAGAGQNKVIKKVFSKPAILHVLRFIFPSDDDFTPFVRDLGSVPRKYWRSLDTDEDPANPGRKKKRK
jgi:hypothetical protein